VRYFGMKEKSAATPIIGKKLFFCVGKHAIYFLKPDMSSMIPGGDVFYAYVAKIVEDTETTTQFLVVLNENRDAAWVSENLYVESENRTVLLDHITVAWRADYMWRFGLVQPCPRFAAALTEMNPQTAKPLVRPFFDHYMSTFQGYTFFLHKFFDDKPNAVSTKNTGSYICREDGREVDIMVHDAERLMDLEKLHKDHIRWVAIEYKTAIVESMTQCTVVSNRPYIKKMNLSADIALWNCWEMFLVGDRGAVAVILMRRQYVPPLLDMVQDCAVLIRCPLARLDGFGDPASGKLWTFDDISDACRLTADSFSPATQTFSVYVPIIKAKLDALLFDEEAYRWLQNNPLLIDKNERRMTPKAIKPARRFLKSIIDMIVKEKSLGQARQSAYEDILNNDMEGDVVHSNPVQMAVDFARKAEGVDGTDDKEDRINAYLKRVARYFAYCVDGGILGMKFGIDNIAEAIPQVGGDSQKKLRAILDFLLHIRETNIRKPWRSVSMMQHLRDPEFLDMEFNAPVMMSLIESLYIKRFFSKGQEAQYVMMLGTLLQAKNANVNLKAFVCRHYLELPDEKTPWAVMLPALMEVVKGGTLFLKTYCSAALVSLTANKEQVKNDLMQKNIAQVITTQLKTSDDDLMYYTLVLMINLTKAIQHRAILVQCGTIPILMTILTSSYDNRFRYRILTQLSAVIGQMCNDEDSRKMFVDGGHVVDCFIFVFRSTNAGTPIKTKVMFALRQLIVNSFDLKAIVGKQVIGDLCSDLQNIDLIEATEDFVRTAFILVKELSKSSDNCFLLDRANLQGCVKRIKEKVKPGTRQGEMERNDETLRIVQATAKPKNFN